MSVYDLLDHQKEIVRQLVKVYRDTGDASFFNAASSAGLFLFFDVKPQPQVEYRIGDLEVLESEGLISLRWNAAGKIGGGTVRQAAMSAVDTDFKRPAPPAAIGAVYQSFYAPVGAVSTGPGNITIGTQNVGLSGEDVALLIAGMRGALQSLPPEQQDDAAETIDDLETELRAQVPKQSRIKAFARSLWAIGKGSTEFALKLTQLANAYGVDTKVLS